MIFEVLFILLIQFESFSIQIDKDHRIKIPKDNKIIRKRPIRVWKEKIKSNKNEQITILPSKDLEEISNSNSESESNSDSESESTIQIIISPKNE